MLSLNFQTNGNFKVSVKQEVPSSIVAVFGPSGSGKTTLLRAIAGFEASEGYIRFDNEMWLDSSQSINISPDRRPLGYVRQNPALFPHLSILNNLKVPLKFGNPHSIQFSLEEVIETFKLQKLLQKSPFELSGGETQRVAIARSILRQPKLLLLDEPLTGLDLQRKAEILPFLRSLYSTFQIPTLYVSHSIDELISLCSHTLVLVGGRAQVFGETHNVLERRELNDVLEEPGEASSLIHAQVLSHDLKYRLTKLQIKNQSEWSIPYHSNLAVGDSTTLRVRARDVAVARSRPKDISVRNILKGTISELNSTDTDLSVECVIQSGRTRLRSQITRLSLDEIGFKVGEEVFALVKAVTLD